jgi:hypothetical protein
VHTIFVFFKNTTPFHLSACEAFPPNHTAFNATPDFRCATAYIAARTRSTVPNDSNYLNYTPATKIMTDIANAPVINGTPYSDLPGQHVPVNQCQIIINAL